MKIKQNIFLTRFDYLLEIGYQQNQLKYLRQVNIFFQFIFLYIFKLFVIDGSLNPSLKTVTESIIKIIQSPVTLIVCNLISLISPFIYGFWLLLEKIQKKSQLELQEGFFSAHNFKKIGTRVYIAAEFIFIISETLNFKLFYFTIFGNESPHPLLLLLTIFSTFLVTSNLLIFPNSLLLNRFTFPIILCCLSVDQNVIAVRIIALIFVLISLREESYLHTYVPLERSLKFMLVLLFVLHAFVNSISMLYFVMLNLVLVAVVFTYPDPEFEKDSKVQNEVLLSALEKFRKEKGLNRSEQIEIMKILLTYEVSVNDELVFSYDPSKDLTYQYLSELFKTKVLYEVSLQKQEDTFKLQYFRYAVLHEKLNLSILHQIQAFSSDLQDSTKFREKVELLELKHLISNRFTRRCQERNLNQVMKTCLKLEEANINLKEILQILEVYWNKFQRNKLSETYIYEALTEVLKKEAKIEKIIQQLRQYPQAKTQVFIYNYALKVLNFDYESEDLKPLRDRNQKIGEVTGSYFIILQEKKIADISSEMLVQLRKKKQEVIGQSLEELIPYQLTDFVEESYKKIFDSENEPERLVLPFLSISQRMTPFRVQLEVRYHLEKGLQYVIHFFKSEDLKECPSFLYCLTTDKILYGSSLFFRFLEHYKRKMERQMLASELFSSEFNRALVQEQKGVKDIITCTLLRQKTRQVSIEINLKILQSFCTSKFHYFIISVDNQGYAELEGSTNTQAMKTFISKKVKETREEQLRSYRNEISCKSETEVTFCRIPNSYETTIFEKMTKVTINCRWSYLKVVAFLILLSVAVLSAGVFFSRSEIERMTGEISKIRSSEAEKSTEIETSYFLFYQYYQYYQIKNYPQQILDIQSYDLESIVSSYYQKSNKNIVKLMSVPQNNLLTEEHNYTLEFPHFNATESTSSTSILDFLSDLKRSLNSNDPKFSVINEHNIGTFIDSYQRVYKDLLSYNLGECDKIMIVVMVLSAFSFIVIKCVFFRIRKNTKEILEVYELMDSRYVSETTKKYEQLRNLVQYSGSEISGDQGTERELVLSSRGQLNHQPRAGSEEQHMNIKKESFWQILLSSNYLLIGLLITLAFLLGVRLSVENYRDNMTLVILKNYNIHKTVTQIVRPAERYFQDAMQELLPLQKRKYYPPQIENQINISLFLDQLPKEFEEYQKMEWEVLEYNLCEYSYLTSGALYQNINCSLILNGIMDRTLSETYTLYLDLTRNYSGSVSPISQLGKIFRPGAKYPVFMEICYTRRTLNNIIRYLQENMNSFSEKYIQTQNGVLVSVLYYAIILFPLILIVSILQMRQLCNQCNAIVKSFRLLPMNYLLNVKITKLLKKRQILQKVEMMPL